MVGGYPYSNWTTTKCCVQTCKRSLFWTRVEPSVRRCRFLENMTIIMFTWMAISIDQTTTRGFGFDRPDFTAEKPTSQYSNYRGYPPFCPPRFVSGRLIPECLIPVPFGPRAIWSSDRFVPEVNWEFYRQNIIIPLWRDLKNFWHARNLQLNRQWFKYKQFI